MTLKKFFVKGKSFDVAYLQLRVELHSSWAFLISFLTFYLFQIFFVKLCTFKRGGLVPPIPPWLRRCSDICPRCAFSWCSVQIFQMHSYQGNLFCLPNFDLSNLCLLFGTLIYSRFFIQQLLRNFLQRSCKEQICHRYANYALRINK